MKKNVVFPILLSIFTLGTGYAAPNPSEGVGILEQTSKAFTEIAKTAMPATVFIKAQITPTNNTPMSPFDMFGDDFFRRFFGNPYQNPQQQKPQMAGGSGFFISSDGYIVTNNHVVQDATEITVHLNDGREYPAVVKGKDPRTDLAVLKIHEQNLPFLKFGDSDLLEVGEWVVATGNPFGLEATLTHGIVSAKGRQDIGIASYEDFIQTDAAINPGNSGGPLLNLEGEVIGVNTAIFSRSGGYMGIGFAIPSKMAQNVISQIVDNGTVQRAYLGVVLQPIDKELSDALNLEKQEGILIADVMKDSPADKAGIKAGDIILYYEEKKVKNVNKFRNDIALMSPGMSVKLRILREGKIVNLKVVLGSQEEEGEVVSSEILQKLGIDVENLTPELAQKLGYDPEINGVVISKVKPNSPAANAGLRPYYLITGTATSLNQQKKISNTKELENSFKEFADKKYIILIVRHQNFQRYYTIKMN